MLFDQPNDVPAMTLEHRVFCLVSPFLRFAGMRFLVVALNSNPSVSAEDRNINSIAPSLRGNRVLDDCFNAAPLELASDDLLRFGNAIEFQNIFCGK